MEIDFKKFQWKLKILQSEINSQIRGWINYYGHYHEDLQALYGVANDIDTVLVRWIKRKYKIRVGLNAAWEMLGKIKKQDSKLFCHWYMLASAKPIRAV